MIFQHLHWSFNERFQSLLCLAIESSMLNWDASGWAFESTKQQFCSMKFPIRSPNPIVWTKIPTKLNFEISTVIRINFDDLISQKQIQCVCLSGWVCPSGCTCRRMCICMRIFLKISICLHGQCVCAYSWFIHPAGMYKSWFQWCCALFAKFIVWR